MTFACRISPEFIMPYLFIHRMSLSLVVLITR